MYTSPQSEKNATLGRRLMLAENYRTSPNFKSLARGSVYDAPKLVVMDTNQEVTKSEQKEIQSSVHAAILGIST